VQFNLDTILDTGDGMREYKSGTYVQLPSGKWRGRVSAPDGRRISVTRDTEAECKRELRRLTGKVANNQPVASTNHTVRSWLAVWLEEAKPTIAPRTYTFYDSYCRVHIVPEVGGIRLTSLKADDVTRMMRNVQAKGLSPNTAAKCRTVLRRAMRVAQEYGHVATNVADVARPPKQVEPERPTLDADQARAVLRAVEDDRMRARFHVALLLGMRQGELLGLRWQDVDLDAAEIAVRQQLQRLQWRHGCQPNRPDPGRKAVCGHQRGDQCPQRHGGGVVMRTPKSKAGRRRMPIPTPLLTELRAHRKRQAEERLQAGPLWADHGLVFCQADGKPIDPATDWKRWRGALKRAGVPEVGTHAARRTAATLLLEAGVDAKIVAAIIGHSSVQLTMDIYQQADTSLLKIGTDAIGGMLGSEHVE
jgi:integrase